MTPDAGSSDKVNTNRGFVFIPEVDDKVLVGFRNGDPNRPYVMGSLFNGSTAAGGGESNKIKSITTRSGSSLQLDDSNGSVTLHDRRGVQMSFDGGGNHSLNANSTSTTTVGKEASVLKMDSSGVIDLSGQTSVTLKVGNSSIVITDETITINGKNINVVGENNTINGVTNVEGQTITIKGNPVNIN